MNRKGRDQALPNHECNYLKGVPGAESALAVKASNLKAGIAERKGLGRCPLAPQGILIHHLVSVRALCLTSLPSGHAKDFSLTRLGTLSTATAVQVHFAEPSSTPQNLFCGHRAHWEQNPALLTTSRGSTTREGPTVVHTSFPSHHGTGGSSSYSLTPQGIFSRGRWGNLVPHPPFHAGKPAL